MHTFHSEHHASATSAIAQHSHPRGEDCEKLLLRILREVEVAHAAIETGALLCTATEAWLEEAPAEAPSEAPAEAVEAGAVQTIDALLLPMAI